MNFTKCALTTYTFIPTQPDPRDPSGARRYLDAVWNACGALGMSERFRAGTPLDVPATPTTEIRYQIVAGRSCPPGEAAFEAYAFVRHDVLGAVLSLAPNRFEDKLSTWGELYGRWTDAVGDTEVPSSILGEVLVFTAQVVDGFDLDAPKTMADSAYEALQGVGLEMWDGAYVTTSDFVLWEGTEPKGRRVIVVLASAQAEAEEELDRWLWWRRNDQELVPFGRYLVNASKVHYEANAYWELRGRTQHATQELKQRLKSVLREHMSLKAGEHVSLDALIAAESEVFHVQLDEMGLMSTVAHLRELRNTVRVAAHNIKTTVPAPRAGSTEVDESFFARDGRLAEWLEQQIDTDVEYAQVELDRARGAQALTALQLDQTTDWHQRFQDRILLVQTITAGMLIGALTVVTWLGLEGPRRASLAAPLALAVAAFLLAFPLVVAHWRAAYSLLDQVSVVVFSGLVLWLVAAAVWEAAEWWAALAAFPGAIVGWQLVSWHDRKIVAHEGQSRP